MGVTNLEDQPSKATRLNAEAVVVLETLEYPQNYDVAEPLFREAVELGTEQPLRQKHFEHVGNLAICLQDRHKISEALEIVERELARVDRTDNLQMAMTADLTFVLARLEIEDGQMEKADAHLIEAIENKVVADSHTKGKRDAMIREHETLQSYLGRPGDKLSTLLNQLTKHRREPLAQPRAYHSVLEQITAIHIQDRKFEVALETVSEARALLQLDWDKARIREQWDAMVATIHNRIKNS